MTDSQRKAMEQANDVWIDLRMAGVNSSEANILPHVERIAAALDAARAEALEEAAKVATNFVFETRTGRGSKIKTSSWRVGDAIADAIRALSSEAPAAREGGSDG
jgi:oligoribonuclease (3'-5' exoribonuclease)